MKHVKSVLVLVLFSLTFALPAFAGSHASANELTGSLQCSYSENLTAAGTSGCDLALAKQASINSGAFTSAETPDAALTAHVGDTVTWQITITNDSEAGFTPTGTVTVQDIVPSGVTTVSSVASTGTYTDGNWTFTLGDNLPATLTITTTANALGLVENTATLSDYTSNSVDPPYADSNSANNSDNAYVNVVAIPAPAVTIPAAPVKAIGAPKTGFGVHNSSAWIELAACVLGATGLIGLAFKTRELPHNK
jgi:uncharacterized repeat protein (TIGR01451 family)